MWFNQVVGDKIWGKCVEHEVGNKNMWKGYLFKVC
jgi:hypothetical protein